MNQTPRVLNRTLLFIAGALGVLVGIGALFAALSEQAHVAWQTAGERGLTWTTQLFDRTAPDGSRSWIWFLLLAVIAVVLVLSVLVVAKQGSGRTSTLIRHVADHPVDRRHGTSVTTRTDHAGTVVIDTQVAEQMLADAITRDPAVLSVQVTGYTVRDDTAIRIALALRRGASPARVARQVEDIVGQWDRLLGAEVPVVIDITGGIRARLRSEARVT